MLLHGVPVFDICPPIGRGWDRRVAAAVRAARWAVDEVAGTETRCGCFTAGLSLGAGRALPWLLAAAEDGFTTLCRRRGNRKSVKVEIDILEGAPYPS